MGPLINSLTDFFVKSKLLTSFLPVLKNLPLKKGFKILLTFFFLYFYTVMKMQNKKIFASILFVLISFVCVAQGINPPPPPSPPPPPGLPIDGGLLLVLGLGLIYGAKKILRAK